MEVRIKGRLLALCVIGILATVALVTNGVAADGVIIPSVSSVFDKPVQYAGGTAALPVFDEMTHTTSSTDNEETALPQMYSVHPLHSGRSWQISHL